MGFQNNYFPIKTGEPQPLFAKAQTRIRFEEVDALGMVWHGRYPSYLEDGRIAFGDKYGLDYHLIREKKVMAPVVQLHCDYFKPLRFDENIEIIASLHWSEALRLNFSYEIFNQAGKKAATGYTVQLLTTIAGDLMLLEPDWIIAFKDKWQKGLLL